MSRKVTIVCLVYTIAGILYAIFAGIFYHVNTESRMPGQPAVRWDKRMEASGNGNTIDFCTILPEEDIAGKTVVYNSVHTTVHVTIDGKEIYSLEPSKKNIVKTTGYDWIFIPLSPEDAGKEIVFHVASVYSDSHPKKTFYYGTANAVEHLIVAERFFRFMVTATILIMGILLFLYALLVAKNIQEDSSLFHFTIFAIFLGTWLVCESQLLELFLPWQIAIVFVDHLMLMLMPVPFVQFLRQMYLTRDHVIWNLYCYFNCGIIGLRLLLQLLGVYDLRETLWLTHVSIGIFVVIVICFSLHEIIVNKLTKQSRLNILCVLVIMVTTVLELMQYRLYNQSTPLGSLGFLFYIIVMGISSLHKSRRMMMRAKEAEIYRHLAYVDELTGMYNRTAFNRDINNRVVMDTKTTKQKILPTTIFMFDLNDLKKCNDNFGHEYGDRYITMFSEGLKKIFDDYGNCYRIGGDEFCAIAPGTSQKEIDLRTRRLNQFTEKKNKEQFVVPVSMAMGYAVYDPAQDTTLDDTRRRADEMMYEQKQSMKKVSACADTSQK